MTKWLTDLWSWIDYRLPVQRAWDTHMGKYYAPKNFNFWYFFGVFSLVVLVNQLLTGIWLISIGYIPSASGAFPSVEHIMRDVPWGDIIRYLHSTGASAFFIVVYLHMFRGLMYGSYKAPRELVWIFGMIIYLVLMAEAFMGYVLPWGQMSYWGAQVIVSLFGAIPGVGDGLVEWIRGDFLISEATLSRFFALHVVALPIVLLALVVLHILALHQVGSNNPDGIDIKKHKDKNGVPLDGVPFHPYYTVHDLMGLAVFLFVFCYVVFFMPEGGGFFLEYANFEEANGLKTPEHIAPVWYFTPFYAILRAVTFDLPLGSFVLTSKLLGFIAMGAAIVLLFFLPWLDKSPVRSIRYRGMLPKLMLFSFAAIFVVLGYLGVKSPTDGRTVLSQIGTVYYFVFFLTMPIWSNPKSLQTMSALKRLVSWGVCFALGALLLKLSLTLPNNIFPEEASLGFILSGGEVDGVKYHSLFAHLFASDVTKVPVTVRLFGIILGLFTISLIYFTPKDKIKPEPERVNMKGLPRPMVLAGLLFFLVLTIVPIKAVAAGGAFKCGSIPCDVYEPNFEDKESLQRGAKWFVNYCMGCHSLKFSRYERVARDLEIPKEVMMNNLVFTQQKIGELMTISMTQDKAKKWFGAAPPDLSLVARSRSPEWLYTYLRNFYQDDARPLGVNNRVFANVGMPHVMAELQGLPVCAPGPKINAHGHTARDKNGHEITDEVCGSLAVPEGQKGSMNKDEFNQAVGDLVNFLEYVAEPGAAKRESIGRYVLIFLGIFFVFAYLLNREYWKGIH